MTRNSIGAFLAIIIAAIAALHAGARADETKPAPAPGGNVRTTDATPQDQSDELSQLQETMRRELEDALKRQQSQEARLRELAAQKRALERTVNTLKKDADKRREGEAKRKEDLAKTEKEIAELRSQGETLRKPLIEYLDRLLVDIQAGIPWQKEDRIRAVTDGKVTIASGNPADGLQVVARAQKEEEALGRLVEMATLEIDQNGEKRAVSALHLGLLAVIFANEDGSLLGYVKPGQELADGLAAVSNPKEAKQGYMRTLEILQRRRTPQPIEVFLPGIPLAPAIAGKEPK